MYVKVRKSTAKPGESDNVINISKKAQIQELKKIIHTEMKVEVDQQRLFYKGKQLSDDHRVIDYGIQLNDVIQLMITVSNPVAKPFKGKSRDKILEEAGPSTARLEEKAASRFFQVRDVVEYLNPKYGAWFEAHIVDILKAVNIISDAKNKEPDLIFRILTEGENEPIDVTFDLIRPRSHYTLKHSELLVGQTVLANHNIKQPSLKGYWYDFVITKINKKSLKGTILAGKDKKPLENCTIKFMDQVLRIENLREYVDPCKNCEGVTTKPCRKFECKICAGRDEINKILVCNECDYGYHMKCLKPPLVKVPLDPEWYCPSCKNDDDIVKPGDKLKFSSKKTKLVSAKHNSSDRDWGSGMACVGRTKECTIVPKNHYGPVPGVEVGTCWKFRLQVSEAGVHRPHVAGIHGRETDGAYSVVLSGGYEDDIDNGEEFIYTGSGGRDLSGNKRASKQSCDQVLTRMNKALALNCNVPLNKNGAKAKNWKDGKPVRVVRNYKLAKVSKYGPKDGNRYDGIYKVVKYYLEKGKSGFLVWKYVLRRDDPLPPPWSKNGQELEMLYPDGYLEAKGAKAGTESARGVKRNASNTPDPTKKRKLDPFKLTNKVAKAIAKDKANEKQWIECKQVLKEGKSSFLTKVQELFKCICCQEILHLPISTQCKHNVCMNCLKRSFSAEVYSCPHCRFDLGKEFKMKINTNLSATLLALFPGYQAHR